MEPPFPFHGAERGGARVTAATIRTEGSSVAKGTQALDNVVELVGKEHDGAVNSADGDLKTPLNGARRPVDAAAGTGRQLVTFAAACIDKYADAVTVFDETSTYPRSVTTLNADWETEVASDFGVAAARYNMHMDADERQAIGDAHDSAVASARAKALREFQGEYALLVDDLDREAHAVADLLKAGPTNEAVRELWGSGNMPPGAPMHWPELDLEVADLPYTAQEDLARYLQNHPELLTSGKPWVEDALENLPSSLREDVQVMQRKQQLHEDGLLTDPKDTNPWYDEWIRRTLENDVPLTDVTDIARDHGIRPDDFDVLGDIDPTVDGSGNAMQDNTGKWFFLLPTDISGADAQKAVLMTYLMNAGTGYRDGQDTDGSGDFEPEDYDADTIQRIIDRQDDNGWSYSQDVAFVHGNGGRLVTTPNGMIMGAGGNGLQDMYSFSGGTTYGDIFMINEDDPDDAAEKLREIIESGDNPSASDSDKDLDRLLNHEEIHSQQYADEGLFGFLGGYLAEQGTSWSIDEKDGWGPLNDEIVHDMTKNDYEEEAGLSDGNYTPDP